MNEQKEVVIKIESLANSGDGVGRNEAMVHFVPFAVPGDLLEVAIEKKKKSFCRSTIVRIVEPSEHRIEPPCPYFGDCGGCSWQQVDYAEQLRCKSRIVADAMTRIAKIKDVVVADTVASPLEYGYRLRERFAIRRGKTGFFAAGSNRFVPVGQCMLADPEINEALKLLGPALADKDFRGYDGSVEITLNPDGELTLDFGPRLPLEQRETLVSIFKKEARDYTVYEGQRAFVQTNNAVNSAITERLLALPQLSTDKSLVELYAGSGNFTLALAGRVGSVTAVEKNREAVAQLEAALRDNDISNVELIRKWSVSALADIIESGKKPELVLLDPPRDGAAEDIRQIAELRPATVIYVSCNASTLARDISLIESEGYAIDSVTPFDMFPQTPHVEILTVLNLKG